MQVRERVGTRWYAAGLLVLMAATASCSPASRAQSDAAGAQSSQSGALPGVNPASASSGAETPRSTASVTAVPTAEETWQDPWLGKADVSVFLCGKADTKKDCPEGPVTAAQRDAIRAELKSFPEIREIFHESPQEAHQAYRRVRPEAARDILSELMPESFRVKLRDPSRFSDNLAGLRGTPGISLVIAVKPR